MGNNKLKLERYQKESNHQKDDKEEDPAETLRIAGLKKATNVKLSTAWFFCVFWVVCVVWGLRQA